MRRLANWMLTGNVLPLGAERFLYYPGGAVGAGYVVAAEQWHSLESFVLLRAWVLIAMFAFPRSFVATWMDQLLDLSLFASQDIACGLWLLYVVALWMFRRRQERLILEQFDLRDRAFWDNDMDRMEALSEAENKGWRGEVYSYVYLACLILSGAIIGVALSASLLLLLAP